MEEIRMGNLLDLLAISKVHAETWREAYRGLINEKYLNKIYDRQWVAKFSQILQGKDYMVTVYTIDGEVTGCITYGKRQEYVIPTSGDASTLDNIGEIISFYVLPKYWGKQQGYKLIEYAEKKLKEKGYNGVYLWMLIGNERALKFYRRFGFIEENLYTEYEFCKENTVEQRLYKKF